MMEKNKYYGLQVKPDKFESGIVIYNSNSFELNELDVQIVEDTEERSYHINTIHSLSEWAEKQHQEKTGVKRQEFHSFGYYEGKRQNVDISLFHEDTGIYEGEPHDALVWPDTDSDEKWRKQITFRLKENTVEVNISFIARGPKIAFCGHSFTGLWDSSYYYFRELAKMGGWNARIAYSYWGGTGIAHYAGLVEGCEEREFLLTLTSEEMADENAKWYKYLAKELGKDTDVLPVCLGYAALRKRCGLSVNPYIAPEKGGDYGHQNNIGNYIAACLLYAYIFNESPEGLGVPVSHTSGMPGGKVTEEQAQVIQQVIWQLFRLRVTD